MCTYDFNTTVSAKIIREDGLNSIKILLLRCWSAKRIYNCTHITYTIRTNRQSELGRQIYILVEEKVRCVLNMINLYRKNFNLAFDVKSLRRLNHSIGGCHF